MKIIENLGLQYNKEKTRKSTMIVVECELCEKHITMAKSELKRKKRIRCQKCGNKTHGASKSKLFMVWASAIARCTNPNDKRFNSYGGRGISMCKEWMDDFSVFQLWALENGYQEGLMLDRTNNDKGYSKSNCMWTNNTQQTRNTRLIKSNNTSGYRGVSFNSADKVWCAKINGKYLGRFSNKEDAAKAYNYEIDKYGLSNPRNIIHNSAGA